MNFCFRSVRGGLRVVPIGQHGTASRTTLRLAFNFVTSISFLRSDTSPSDMGSLQPAKVKSPSMLAHVVLRTNNYRNMVEYYKNFLGAHASFENEVLAFLRYDEEHHRIAILGIPDAPSKIPGASGLEHTAFTFDNLDDLMLSYAQRKEIGILPTLCINHGPTTSIYYTDPDGNMIETQVDNFDTADEASEFMMSPAFKENPIGTDFDPEEMIVRLQSGERHADIKKRIEIGPRGLPGAHRE